MAPGAELHDALRLVGRSSRQLAREARARYTSDLLKWRHRRSFDPIWSRVEMIPGWFNEGSAVVIDALMRERPPTTVVEIGSYLGRSTIFFALTLQEVNPAGRVVAIDPHTGDRQQLESLSTDRLATFELFAQHCRAVGVDAIVEPHVATSLEVAGDWSAPLDLLYVDGWHAHDAVVADGEAWLPHLSERGVVIFDDYAAYADVRAGVHELAHRGLFHFWGPVFGQAFGGRSRTPPPSLRRALRLSSGARGR